MNILMLNYEFPPIGGGASPVSYDIAKGLADRGYHITVITMSYKELPRKEQICNGMIDVIRVKSLRTQKMVCHPWEQLTYIISAITYIRKHIDTKNYALCYTHFIIPTGVIAWWMEHKYHIPYIITSHGSDVIGHNNKRFKLLYALVKKPWCAIVRNARAIVSPSVYLKELMESNEQDAHYEVIQNGVDTQFFARSMEKKKKILVMCRLQETKNVQTIIKALQLVDLGEWQVEILGDGPYKDILMTMVAEYKLEKQVRFCGWITNKSAEHLKCLQETSIYLSASRVENCPTSILEAIACGSRILLSNIPAHKQLIEDDGAFFHTEDEKELADKLQKLIEEDSMTNQYDVQKCDWKASIDQYEELLWNVTKESHL